MKVIPDWDHAHTWTTICDECGGVMHFNKSNFAYYCSHCGNILEV